jgi:hypothetical protein
VRPLVDDLKKLLVGKSIEVYDGYKKECFNLRDMLFTTITNILGHRSVSGQTKGEKDCFECLDDMESVWLNNTKKKVYVRHQHFLPKVHLYREIKCEFYGMREK